LGGLAETVAFLILRSPEGTLLRHDIAAPPSAIRP